MAVAVSAPGFATAIERDIEWAEGDAEAERKPACVIACPTSARLFGDVHDPASEVSKAISERGGYALMPEWETNPANRYLPRKPTTAVAAAPAQGEDPRGIDGAFDLNPTGGQV